jgi:ABC-type Fe3+ transport system substrate-binding protein
MRFTRIRLASMIALLMLAAAATAARAETLYEQLIADSKAEMAKLGGTLRVGLDWPDSDAKPVFEEFAKAYPFIKIAYRRETGVPPFQRYFIAIGQGQYPPYEVFGVASEFEKQYWDAGYFVKPKYDFAALAGSLPAGWPQMHPAAIDPGGRYLATVAQMRGNAWNVAMVKPGDEPKSFADCANPKWQGEIVLDARNKTQALVHDPATHDATVATIKAMKANGATVINGQAQVLARVVAGEFALTCYINYHTTQRLIDQGETSLKFALGDVVPVELATRLGVPKWTAAPATAELVAIWLATAGQPVIDRAAYRGFPWIPGSSLYEKAKGKPFAICAADCAAKYEEYDRQYADLLGIPYVKD